MIPKTEPLTVARISKIEIGLDESAVVQVELGDAKGYLIAEGYTAGEPPSEIALEHVIYMCVHPDEIYLANISEVLITKHRDSWSAVDTSEVCIIPCPASQPYPVIFISKHGFRWMLSCIHDCEFGRLLEHLVSRFEPADFVTDRRILVDPASPFSKALLVRGALVHRFGGQDRST